MVHYLVLDDSKVVVRSGAISGLCTISDHFYLCTATCSGCAHQSERVHLFTSTPNKAALFLISPSFPRTTHRPDISSQAAQRRIHLRHLSWSGHHVFQPQRGCCPDEETGSGGTLFEGWSRRDNLILAVFSFTTLCGFTLLLYETRSCRRRFKAHK